MTRLLLAFLSWFGAFFRSRHDLALELVALRQQVGVLKGKNPRPQLSPWDRLFWLGLASKAPSATRSVQPLLPSGGRKKSVHDLGRIANQTPSSDSRWGILPT